MSTLLELTAIRGMALASRPYRWALLAQTFTDPSSVRTLQESFPRDGFTAIQSAGLVKPYLLHGRALLGGGLPPLWGRLYEELTAPSYREALADCTGLRLDTLDVEFTLWRQPPGSFLGPHTDKPDKVLSHIIYFSDVRWPPSAGGCVRVLGSANLEDVVMQAPPHAGTSFVLVRSGNSWHGYDVVREGFGDRCSLQITFHHPTLRYSSALA